MYRLITPRVSTLYYAIHTQIWTLNFLCLHAYPLHEYMLIPVDLVNDVLDVASVIADTSTGGTVETLLVPSATVVSVTSFVVATHIQQDHISSV